MSARVARLCPPGNWYYIAVCEHCRWSGFSWKHRAWAKGDADMHNDHGHPMTEQNDGSPVELRDDQ